MPTGREALAVVELAEAMVTGGQSGTDDIACRVRLANVGHGVEMSVRLTAGGFAYVIDVGAGGTLLAAVPNITAGVAYQWRIGMYLDSDTGAGRELQVWYRAADTSENRQWTRVGAFTLADDSAAGGAAPFVQWGHRIAGGGATINRSRWRQVKWSMPSYAGSNWALTT